MIGPVDASFSLRCGEGEAQGRFDWRALDRLRAAFGPSFEAETQRAFAARDVARIAIVLEATTGRPASDWMEASPPILPTVKRNRPIFTARIPA